MRGLLRLDRGRSHRLNAYLPTDARVVASLVGLLATLAAWLVVVHRIGGRGGSWPFVLAWLVAIAQLPITDHLLAAEPAGFRMVGLVLTTLLAMKAVPLAARRADGMTDLRPVSLLLYAFAWVGMEPLAFARRGAPRPAAVSLGRQALVLATAALGWVAAHALAPSHPLLATIPLALAASLVLHFTLLRLLGACLRRLGYAVREPFDRPLASTSLTEFWGRRWNRPFVELGALAVFRPLRSRVGRGPALLAMFAVSGLLHEMALSLPVRAGYGGPFAYFFLHGVLVLLEPRLDRKGWKPAGAWGLGWTLGWLLLPIPLLFHPPFLEGVLLPLAS